MSEILSEQEVQALLSDASARRADPAAGDRARCLPFSFDAPLRLDPEERERISDAAARFADAFRRQLEEQLRRQVAVGVSGVDLLGRGEFDRLLSGGVRLALEGLTGRRAAEFVFETETALALVEARLGGGIPEPQPKRPLTSVEMSLLAGLVAVCGASALEGGPAPGAPARRGGREASGKVVCRPAGEAVAPSGGLASVGLQLSIDGRGGGASLLMPAGRAVEWAAAGAGASRPSVEERPAGARVPAGALLRMPVRIVPQIPGGAISLRDLMAIRPGHVVRLDLKEGEPIEVTCNGKRALKGRLIRSGSVAGLEIAGWTEPRPGREEES